MRSGRTIVFLISIILLAAAVLPVEARTVFRHDTAQRVVKACVLGIGGQTADDHENPYLIEGMRRSHLKPDDWVFENPLAPAITSEQVAVKGGRDYWFVELTDQNASRLAGMDFIYVADTDGRAPMTPAQQDGLLAAVEAGALLWIDTFHTGDLEDLHPFLVSYESNGDSGFMRVAADPTHGLLREPHRIDDLAVARLGDLPDREAYEAGEWTSPGDYLVDEGGHFRPIVEVGTLDAQGQVVDRLPFIMAAQYGSGTVIISTGQVSRDVAAWVVRPAEGGTDWRPTPDHLQAPDVKLALNMVQWNRRWQQARGTPRASATSIARAPMPLEIAWQYPGPDDGETLGAVVSTPVYDNSRLYAVSLPVTGREAMLMSFDADPRHDQMDEMRYATGRQYDMIHSVALSDGHGGGTVMTPRYASPTLTSYRSPGGTVYPLVVLVSYVDDENGTGWVDCYDVAIYFDEGEIIETPTRLWRREIEAYDPAGGEVVALSTPVVHNGLVYVLATEFDGMPYGRVHCFELNYPWAPGNPWPEDAAWWVYPSHEADMDGSGTGATEAEDPHLLPTFHDPVWVGDVNRPHLPPEPGAIPLVHSAVTRIDGVRVDAAVTFGTAATHAWDGSNIVIDAAAGGSQFTLIPAPMWLDTRDHALNAEYFLVRTNQEIDTGDVETHLDIDPSIGVTVVDSDERYVVHDPGSVREAIVEAGLAGVSPLEAQLGIDVQVSYDAVDASDLVETHRLQGPVRWLRTFAAGETVPQPSAMGLDDVVVSTPWPGGTLHRLDAGSGEVRWSYDPRDSVPGMDVAEIGVTAPAVNGESIVMGSTAEGAGGPRSSVIGLHRQMDASVNLLHQPEDGVEPLSVSLVRTGEIISPSSYSVDPWVRRLTFPAATAGNVRSDTGDWLGSIYGRAITIEWPGDIFEDRLVPLVERFHHTADYIKLRHYPVQRGSIQITRPDGTEITGWDYVGPADDFGHPADVRSCSLDGWIDMSNAAVEPGDIVLVSYTGWVERDYSGNGLPEGFVAIPRPGWNLPAEAHQIAAEFGAPGPPVLAGDAVHMGAEPADGIDADAAETMLSLLWNRATGLVRSSLMRPIEEQTGVDGTPIIESSPSVAEDRVFVGVRVRDPDEPLPAGYGYVSALRPWRVLIADTNRIVETIGAEPSWVCTGTLSPQRAQSFIGEDLRRPFNRPAKATHLGSGNVLVVDTGNHRVVEIDRAGRVVWPLDGHGYEYYTSPENDNLKLSRPADAYRYYAYERVDYSRNGEPDAYFPVMHTVIADTGNARVINIRTRFMSYDEDAGQWVHGRQDHIVETITPAYVRMGAERGYERVRYTSAQPIRCPENHAVVGYLCAAANLHQLLVVEAGTRRVNPPADQRVGGSEEEATWAQWAWLYDHNVDEAPHVSNEPLRFENIKHAQYRRHGDTIYVTVTAGRYLGREGFLYCDNIACLLRASSRENNPGDECPGECGGTLRQNHHMAAAGAGVFEFEIDVSDIDNPGTWRLVDAGQDDQPHWYFVRRYVTPTPGGDVREDYAGDMTEIAAEGESFSKQWYPVSAQRLPNGRHLIVNSLAHIESATPTNIPDRSAVYGAHIFEVTTRGDGPHGHTHELDTERSIPAPGEMWADPFTQPAYAESR